MATHYEILGISENADSSAIRSAYKRLAMQHHPDKNPGNAFAEEHFKAINEAYHVLSDPLKKARYDSRFQTYATVEAETTDYRQAQRQRYERWKDIQQTRYRFDKQYFRIQGLAFLVFLIIAGFCFGVIYTIDFFREQHYASIYRKNSVLLHGVDSLFNVNRVDAAFEMLSDLQDQAQNEYRFVVAHDSLINVLRFKGDYNFARDDFQTAGVFYDFLKKYETPPSMETLRRIAVCKYQQGEFEEALQSLKRLHNQQPWNLELIYQIGLINFEKLENYDEALMYFNLGKKYFRENLSKVYGEAFELVMNPDDVPDIYFKIFEGRANTNIKLENFADAVKDCNWAITLRKKEGDPYRLRAIAKAGDRKFNDICKDVEMARQYGAKDMEELTRKYCL